MILNNLNAYMEHKFCCDKMKQVLTTKESIFNLNGYDLEIDIGSYQTIIDFCPFCGEELVYY